jgi:hypothetical protein
MPTSNASTGQCATNGWRSMNLTRWPICRTTQRVGCGTIITTAPTWPWAVSPQNSGWPWPRSSTSGSHGKWEDYPATNGVSQRSRSVCQSTSIDRPSMSRPPMNHANPLLGITKTRPPENSAKVVLDAPSRSLSPCRRPRSRASILPTDG